MNLLSILAEKKIITDDDISIIEEEAHASGETIEGILVKKGIETNVILEAKSKHLNLPIFYLEDNKISFDVLNYIPEESAIHYRFVPIAITEGVLEVGIINPDNIEALDALNFISSKINLPFKVYLISESDFKRILGMYKGLSQEVSKALGELELEVAAEAEKDQKKRGKKQDEKAQTQVIKEDAPVTKIVANLLQHAVEEEASDVHIEPMSEHIRVRFRVDGVLSTKLLLPSKVLSAVVSRIKILSSMKLDERRKPQDGRFSTMIKDRRVDFRVSTFPSYYGEKVVMRILDTEKGLLTIEDLGLTERNLRIIRKAVKRTYGIILISGPTGSGKTSTLYSMLNEFDREKKNVLSLEDPIEYNIDGVSQSQVRPEIGYTFATGLRTTLRQDPDIIMVGEIRDKETAALAIQAALTGHLVLSTIHTNNAIGVIPRLIEMGIDPYLIAPTLVIAMAQRLVPKLCKNTGVAVPVEGSIKMMIDKEFENLPEEFKKEIPKGENVYEVEITKECPTGTKGRIAVFEILEVDKELEKIILTNPKNTALQLAARKRGMFTMKEDAMFKAFNKIIPFKEVNALGTEFLTAEADVEIKKDEAQQKDEAEMVATIQKEEEQTKTTKKQAETTEEQTEAKIKEIEKEISASTEQADNK